MAEMNSFLQIFALVNLIGILVFFLIRVSIQALILRYFTKKYNLSQNYGKAWFAILIPSLIVSIIGLPLAFLEVPNFLLIIIWFLFFPMLIFLIKSIYKTEIGISTAISFKFFLVILILVVAIAGIQTVMNTINDPLDPNTNIGPGCTTACEFRYPLGGDKIITRNGVRDTSEGNTSLTIRGYKSAEIINEKTFNLSELDSLKTGEKDSRGFQLIEGKLDANECMSMEFLRLDGGSSKRPCKEPSKGFISNLKEILVG